MRKLSSGATTGARLPLARARTSPARALTPTPPPRRCGLYEECEPEDCGKGGKNRWCRKLAPVVYEKKAACTLDNLQKIGDLEPEQLPIDCKGKTLKTSGKVIITDAGGDKVDFTSAKIEAAKGITIKKALGGKFEAASLFTTGDEAEVRPAARLPVHRLPLHTSSRLCAQIDFDHDSDRSEYDRNPSKWTDAVFEATGEGSRVTGLTGPGSTAYFYMP